MNPAPEKMVVVGSVDLSDNVGMYEALKEASSNYSDMEILFDDARKLVWINWYKGVK